MKLTETKTSMLLTPREAAATLGISPRKLWALSHDEGTLPFCKIGRLVRYSRAEIERWISAHTVGGRP